MAVWPVAQKETGPEYRTGSSAKSGGAPNRAPDAPPGARRRCKRIALFNFLADARRTRKWETAVSAPIDASRQHPK
jgi:hypothetical protein